MNVKLLLLVFCLQEVLGYDCAEDETFVLKNTGQKLGITKFDLKDWSVKYVEYASYDHRTVAFMNDIQPGWKLKKLQIGDAPQNLLTDDLLINHGIKQALQNPDFSCKMCFDTKEEKARFYTRADDLFNVEKSHAYIEYDWSNWTVKQFQTTNIIGDRLIEKGSFPRVKSGWKIASVHFWHKIQEKNEFFDDPKSHRDSKSIKARLLDKVPHTITFQKRALDSNYNSNDMNQQKDESEFFGKDAYVMKRSVKNGTGQAYEGKVFENYEGKGTEYFVKYKNSHLERHVDLRRLWKKMPECFRCHKLGHDGPFCPTIKCSICSKVGHSNKRCWNDELCRRCNQFGHYENECPKASQCHNCWEVGHKESECSNEMLCFNCCRTGHSKYSRDCPKASAGQRDNLQRKTLDYALNDALQNKNLALNTSPFSRSNSKNFDSPEKKKSLHGKSVDYNPNDTPLYWNSKDKNLVLDTPLSRSNSKKFELAQNGCSTSPSPKESWKFRILIPESSPKNHQNLQDSVASKKSQKEKNLNGLGNPPKSFRKLSYTGETSRLSPKKEKIASPSKNNKKLYSSKDQSIIASWKFSIQDDSPKNQRDDRLNSVSNKSKTVGSQNRLDSSTSKNPKEEKDLSQPESFQKELKRKRRKSGKHDYFEEIYDSTPEYKKGFNLPRHDYLRDIFDPTDRRIYRPSAEVNKKEVDANQNSKDYQPEVVCLNDQRSSDSDDKQKISTTEKTKNRRKSAHEEGPGGIRKHAVPLYIEGEPGELDIIKQTPWLGEKFNDIYEPDASQTNPTKRQSSEEEEEDDEEEEAPTKSAHEGRPGGVRKVPNKKK